MTEYQHYTENHESFHYNSDEEKPFLRPDEKKADKNIKGIELEIKDPEQDKINDYLDKLIDNNVICSYDTMYDYKRKYANCVWTYDGTVDHELVIQAELPRNLALKLKMLNKYLNPNTVCNESGTSVHVHMNNQYLNNLGLKPLDMIKAGEAVSGVLLNVSGRQNHYELDTWVKTRLKIKHDMPIALRSRYIDKIKLESERDLHHHPGHYMMINVYNMNTTEVRMFSNYHNFDYDRIKLFLESCDMITDVALAMQNLSYKNNYEIVVDIVDEFYNKNSRRRKYLPEVQDNFTNNKDKIYNLESSLIIDKINSVLGDEVMNFNPRYATLTLIRDLQEEFDFTYNGIINIDNFNDRSLRDDLIGQILRR